MAEPKPFRRVKLICGIISSKDVLFSEAENELVSLYGSVDLTSPLFRFDFTDYYEKQMGKNLKRRFISFVQLIAPEELSQIKLQTNNLEKKIREKAKSELRAVNLDPGYLTSSALVMATTKDFAHRIPLQHGIYAHLELLFGRKDIKTVSWTYPDYKTDEYQKFFMEVRRIYLSQLAGL